MTAKYSVIQFAPNAISGERINIGVIVYSESDSRVRFLTNWRRVRAFSGGDVGFLKDFAAEMEALASSQLSYLFNDTGPDKVWSYVEKFSERWANSIMLTPPRSSLKSLDKLLETISSEFLTQPRARERGYRNRLAAASIAKDALFKALEDREDKPDATKYLQSQQQVIGKYGPHQFDAVVGNGAPRIAAHGISFELPEAVQLDQLVDAVAFQVFDTYEAHPDLHIGILALAPKGRSPKHAKKAFDRATRTYEGLSAEVVLESDAETWAKSRVSTIEL